MADNFITVSQYKARVAAIPSSLNTREIIIADEQAQFPMISNRSTGPNGELFYTTRAMMDLKTGTVTVLA
jgi:hypothetical protein